MSLKTRALVFQLFFCVVITSFLFIKDVSAANKNCSAKKVIVVMMNPNPNSLKSIIVKIDGTIQKNGLDILNGLSKACGDHVAILVHEDVSVGKLTQMLSMAGKAGFLRGAISTFIFYKNREWMMDIRRFKNVSYTENPNVIEKLITTE